MRPAATGFDGFGDWIGFLVGMSLPIALAYGISMYILSGLLTRRPDMVTALEDRDPRAVTAMVILAATSWLFVGLGFRTGLVGRGRAMITEGPQERDGDHPDDELRLVTYAMMASIVIPMLGAVYWEVNGPGSRDELVPVLESYAAASVLAPLIGIPAYLVLARPWRRRPSP